MGNFKTKRQNPTFMGHLVNQLTSTPCMCVRLLFLEERRASANEALLGLNSYAHLLAAYSTMGIYGGGGGAPPPMSSDRAASSASNAGAHYSPTAQQTPQQHPSSPRRSMEEEAECYLSQRGASK